MTGPANLGFFESSIDRHLVTRRAENVWVLVVHYDYKGKDVVRKGDDVDVKNLRSTFEEQRNCNFRDLLSVEKEHLLLLLSDHTKLFTLFDCKDIPDVFVLFFLSHGAEDGVIYTDHCDQDDLIIYFTTDEIFQSLKRLTGFDKCLKLVNFGPCRGELEDGKMRCPRPDRGDYDNRNSCRITFDPEIHNLVIFYSTVEKTQSNRDANCGSWFVEEFCCVLNSMEEDQLLLSALSSVQRRIHVKSRGYNLGAQKHDGQTPEAKLFSQDALFYFSKHPKPTKITNFTDGIGNTKNIIFASDFYSWRSDSGKNLRGRRAFILHEISNDDSVSAMHKALSQNLHFETSERKLSGRAIELLFKDVRNSDEDVGCVLTCIFGQVSEKIIKEKQADPEFMRNPKKEICVLVDGEEKPITDILHRFCGPHNEAWIGKPKIFFILDQTKIESDYLNLRQNNYEILATNHSGWLVLVLKEKRQIAKLIEILNGDDLKKGKCLQRLLYPLLVGETEGNVLLNSTLQHLLDFPEWPRSFVKPDFKLKRGKISAEQVLTFDDLLQEAKETLKENRVWLLSSVAGSGKTTVLREIAFQLGKADCDVKILRIVLPKYRIYFLKKHQVNEVEFLAMASNYSSKEVADWIASNKIVVFLDGFDEICPEYREKVVGLVRVLKERGLPLWIGTRPHEADEIRDKVAQNVVSLSIRSFDETKQNELLNLVAKRNEEENKLFLKSFVANTFLGNPLHLSMLAECGFEDNLYNMYNRVVKQKVKFCLERENGNYMVSVEKVELALIPLRLIASRFISERCLVGQGVSMEQVERMNNFGIATFLDGEVTFLHQTFAEFLAAQQFLIDFQVSGTSGLRMFDRCQWWDYAECRKFVDAYFYNNEDKFEKHSEIVLKMAIDTSPYNFLDIVCCEDLKNIFNLLKPNVSFCLEKERPIRIRNGPRLLLRAIQNEEIAIGLVELGAIDNRKLKKIQRQLLDAIFENNAAKLYKRINDQFSGAFSLLMQETHFETRKKEQLFDAARKGNAEVLTLLIENGGDPNATHDHRNAIYASCEAGHIRCVAILFANNAKVANYFGKTHDPLIVASANGHLDIVKYLLVADQFVRDTETLEIEELKENWNAFHYAIARNQMETAAHLLSISSNLKQIKTEGGMSPLQLAALKNNLKMCRWLVKEGADLKSLLLPGDSMLVCKDHFLMLQGDVNFKDESGKTALHCATQYCYEELVLELIDAGADVKATDQNGWNALHFACVCNASKRIIKILHKKSNALASQRTNNGETALHIFFQTFRKDKTFVLDFVRFLVEEVGVDCEAVDNQGRPALSMVPEQFCWYKAPNYAAIVVKNGKSGINSAAKRGDLNELLKCINMGADINLKNNEGATPLHLAADEGHLKCVQCLTNSGANHQAIWRISRANERRLRDLSEDLEGKWFNSDFKGLVGPTALHLAAEKGHLQVVQWLVDFGASLEAKDHYGRSALMLACRFNKFEVVEYLLGKNASPKKTDKRGKNAMHHALFNLEINKLLHEKDKKLVRKVTENGKTTLHLAAIHNSVEVLHWLVTKIKLDVDTTDTSKRTALIFASYCDSLEAANVLLELGADVNKADKCGKAAMFYAAKWQNLELMQKLLDKGAHLNCGKNVLRKTLFDLNMFTQLHQRNSDLVKKLDQNGDNLLHVAIRKHQSSFRVVRWLIDEGQFDLNARNKKGETALLLACMWRRWDVVDLLLSKNVDVTVKSSEGESALDYAFNWEFCTN